MTTLQIKAKNQVFISYIYFKYFSTPRRYHLNWEVRIIFRIKKSNHQENEKLVTERKYLQKTYLVKGWLLGTIYKELLKVNKKQPIKKWAEAPTNSSPKKIYKYQVRIRKDAAHMISGKWKLKQDSTTHLLGWPKSRNTENTKCWWGYGAKVTLIHCWWEDHFG
jgi:hypothetical protein